MKNSKYENNQKRFISSAAQYWTISNSVLEVAASFFSLYTFFLSSAHKIRTRWDFSALVFSHLRLHNLAVKIHDVWLTSLTSLLPLITSCGQLQHNWDTSLALMLCLRRIKWSPLGISQFQLLPQTVTWAVDKQHWMRTNFAIFSQKPQFICACAFRYQSKDLRQLVDCLCVRKRC